MWTFLRNLRFLPRHLRLAFVLTRHLPGEAGRRIGLRRRTLRPSLLRRVLVDLGPAHILLGRHLRWRADLLPVEACRELADLPESGEPMSWEEVRRVVEEELGRPLEASFSEFSPRPWRCTWLEQVHSARRPDGEEVWVFVPNPVVRFHLERERAFFREVARLLDGCRPAGGNGPAGRALALWEEVMHQRLEARERGRNAERWQGMMGEDGPMTFPSVDWERTGVHLLTCRARPAGPPEEWAAPCPGDVETPVRLLYRFYGRAIFEHGFYPALPEAGDFLVQRDGRPICIALAPAGRLDSAVRRSLLRLLESFSREEEAEVLDAAATLGLSEKGRPARSFRQAVRHMLDRYQGIFPAEVRFEEITRDLLALAGRGVLLPNEILLLLLTLQSVEEIGCRLAPQVSLLQEMAEPLRTSIAARHSWPARGERLVRAGRSWLEALADFPEEATRLLRMLEEGDWQLGMEIRNWERPMRRLERMANRLTVSILAAGLVIALALLLTVLLPVGSVWGWVSVGLFLFSLLLLGLLLLVSFLARP